MPFRIPLSGLTAASSDLKVASNNIANSGTTGFKQSRAEFADVFAVTFGGTSSAATGNGVQVSSVTQQFTQGSIEFSERALDLAVSGQGFFVMEDDAGQTYSRAGSFHVDQAGDVVNNNGQNLQIFPVIGDAAADNVNFNTGVFSDLSLSTTAGPPNPTSQVDIGLNLDASDSVPSAGVFDPTNPNSYNASTSIIVYDSLGSTHTSSIYYVKSSTLNQWDVYTYMDGDTPSDIVTVGGANSTTLAYGSDGTLQTPASGIINYDTVSAARLASGAASLTVQMDYNNTTQFGSQFAVNNLSQDGYSSGQLSGIDIGSEGIVFARFTNGQSLALGKVALASFANQNGLRQLGDTSWAESFESGSIVPGEPGSGSLGLIQSGALEASNVNIAESLVGLITAQRNFQANAQVISTADTVTQTIINI